MSHDTSVMMPLWAQYFACLLACACHRSVPWPGPSRERVTSIFILVLAYPKWVKTHFDLWNQTLNQDMEWTP